VKRCTTVGESIIWGATAAVTSFGVQRVSIWCGLLTNVLSGDCGFLEKNQNMARSSEEGGGCMGLERGVEATKGGSSRERESDE